MNMKVTPTQLQGVLVVETTPLTDDRGAFTRLFCDKQLAEIVGQRQRAFELIDARLVPGHVDVRSADFWQQIGRAHV